MKRSRKAYKRPRKPFDRKRIEEEKKLLLEYGLKNKRELWRAENVLRNFRRRAREIIATRDKKREEELMNKLKRMGIIDKDASVTDVLSLTVRDILERRLQTVVFRKGLARTVKEARQRIVHGFISFRGRRVRTPSMMVPLNGEKDVGYYKEVSKT